MTGATLKQVVKLLVILAVVVALVVLGRQVPVDEVLAWIDGLGFWGPVVLAAVYVVATVLLVPGSLLTLGGGALFGVVTGTLTVSVGATLGACAAFLVGRYAARDWVAERFVAGNERFAAIDAAVGREGFKVVLLTRLSPVFPFNMQNYAYGLTGVSFRDYALASWLGMIPGTIMYVYLGAAAGEVAGAASGEGKSAGEWALYAVGLAATVAVTVVVTRVARRALAQQTGESPSAPLDPAKETA